MKEHATVAINLGYFMPRLETICYHLDTAEALIGKLDERNDLIGQETIDQLHGVVKEIKSRCNRFAAYLRKQEPITVAIDANHFPDPTKKVTDH